MTLTLTSDDLESHIVVNVSSTLTNSAIWFVAALSMIADVRTDGRTYVRTDGWMDIVTGFIRSSPKNSPDRGLRSSPHLDSHFSLMPVVFC